MPKIARVGDSVIGKCKNHSHERDWTGVIQTGSSILTVEGSPAARVGDTGVTDCGHTFVIVEGSSVFKDNSIPVATVGCKVVVTGEGGDGVIQSGASTSDSS